MVFRGLLLLMALHLLTELPDFVLLKSPEAKLTNFRFETLTLVTHDNVD